MLMTIQEIMLRMRIQELEERVSELELSASSQPCYVLHNYIKEKFQISDEDLKRKCIRRQTRCGLHTGYETSRPANLVRALKGFITAALDIKNAANLTLEQLPFAKAIVDSFAKIYNERR